MKLSFSFLIAIALLASCQPNTNQFPHLINSIPTISLPRRLEHSSSNIPNITDSLTISWVKQYSKEHNKYIWGRVFVDQLNIHLLATQPDDLGTVFLITFDKSGKFMTEESLQRGEYISADPQFTTHNNSTLYPDMRLVEIDSLFKYPYDEAANDRLPGDPTCNVTNHEYKISSDGSLKVVRYDTTGFFKIPR